MSRFLWVNRRLAWPPVVAIAYLAASLILADYLWRLTVMPFETFVLYALTISAATALLLIVLAARIRQARRRRQAEIVPSSAKALFTPTLPSDS
jgi:hypothetical protein